MQEEEKTKIQILLDDKKLSKMDLLRMINEEFPEAPIYPSSLYNFINGDTPNVKIITIKRICYVLNCTPNDIID
jgi:DNA-binding Xre family transcriptional regulator